ncbi:DnaJ family domain-containing protein [Microlunatus parietis]|uniref:DnaJ homologue subfamily C member 28 conserved domain-containing protein n=2 Tax=Microlunatus parietis TaxID=682979 RepID=A0A7Y9I9N0_9ACTN|nr:hypothetical protein [Microlunatus parietis]
MMSESWIDAQIRKAEERGDFDDLPGSGKPIPGLGRRQDPNWWLKGYLKREKLDMPLPETLALRKEIEQIADTVAEERSEKVVREIVTDLNTRIVDARRRRTDGLKITIATLEVDPIVEAWRARREAEGRPVRP